MQHAKQHDGRSGWRAFAVALALALTGTAAHAGDSYYGADNRSPSSVGGYEGSSRSPHPHGSNGLFSYPGNFSEGTGPRSDYGHSGDVRKYGQYADASGHHESAYLVRRLFMAGGYNHPDMRLFHYRTACWGEH